MILFGALVNLVAAEETRAYKISPGQTKVEFAIRHYFGSVAGQLREVSGTLHLDSEHSENASLFVTAAARSLDTANATRDRHLQTELFQVEKYPEITFRSRKVVRSGKDEADVSGDLTLHGVTRPLVLHVALLARTRNVAGREVIRWRATGGKVSRHAFGLVWSGSVEAVSQIGDEASLEIEASTVAE